MKLAMALSTLKWRFPWQRATIEKAGTEQRVRFEDLSPHILRNLGFSPQHARDLVALERARFLS